MLHVRVIGRVNLAIVIFDHWKINDIILLPVYSHEIVPVEEESTEDILKVM